ncbi:transcriptional regulator [Brucella rhizosphaerae]|uniref:transcriptional regulator n=1 Tax=Brucella rhizosphaerae TaxID=571254 RepID=UPI000B989169|nr:YdaS family helix-turn-helix protein [Brucella rhizosphaerae]
MIKLTDTLQESAKLAEIARQCKITRGAVSQWDRVPAKHVLTVEVVTGISRHELRPDIYGLATDAVHSNSAQLPVSSSAGDDAGALITPPAQSGAPVCNSNSQVTEGACETGAQEWPEIALRPANNSNSPEVLPSGEAMARCEVRQRAMAINSEEVAR